MDIALVHFAQDVVTGAVDDAVERTNLVAGEALLQRFDNRDAARCASLKIKAHLISRSKLKQFGTIFCQECLVRRNDMLAVLERTADERARLGNTADKLHDDIDIRIVHHLARLSR